ncbi:hypothetical protein RJ639_035147 [Escallonia herrerae]|uniref:RING-type E3 ubiquitin transferase n=1 Tax=Escallonia herrerae TaxID=1293975 RepID=A0AA88WQI0_9ASTE|nr:hypothetical protein RJ639_035147 [Escallonia herrerae]
MSKTCDTTPLEDEMVEDGVNMFESSEICHVLKRFTKEVYSIAPNLKLSGNGSGRDDHSNRLGHFLLGRDIKAIERSYKNFRLVMQNIRCEQENLENKSSDARVSAVLRLYPATMDGYVAALRSGVYEMTLSVEGTWNTSKGQLCMDLYIGAFIGPDLVGYGHMPETFVQINVLALGPLLGRYDHLVYRDGSLVGAPTGHFKIFQASLEVSETTDCTRVSKSRRVPNDVRVLFVTLAVQSCWLMFTRLLQFGEMLNLGKDPIMLHGYVQQIWTLKLAIYFGMVQDFVPLPQIIANRFWKTRVINPVRKAYINGFLLITLLLIFYDNVRSCRLPCVGYKMRLKLASISKLVNFWYCVCDHAANVTYGTLLEA